MKVRRFTLTLTLATLFVITLVTIPLIAQEEQECDPKVENSLSIVQTKIVPVESEKKYQIEATWTPTASSPKSIRDVIKIHTNSKKQPLLQVPLYGLLQKTTASAGQDN